MKLPKLTPKQETILLLLYKFRFLNRIQIQILMGHKDYRRINAWLADLRNNQYVEWVYSTDFLEKSKPAIYYMGLNGIRQLKGHREYPIEELRKRYRESSRSQGFIDRCMLVANCCISMNEKNTTSPNTNRTHYYYETEADYLVPESTFHFLSESDLIRPHLVFRPVMEIMDERTVTTHFIEIIEATMPRYRVRNRLKHYVEYLEDGYWQDETNENESNPIVMFVCPSLADMIYCKRATKRLVEEKWGENIVMWFTTVEKLKADGITGKIWEEVTAPEDDEN